ncbi:uncharacterized protein [Eurosta solidaginis]|uniref:uncharacterized protein n=1 Tax=Eurosta solidaginis TaxID=178769 RepID=UPI003531187B
MIAQYLVSITMSASTDESPAPLLPPEINDMEREILSDSDSDFSPDDDQKDPNYIPNTPKKSAITHYYESIAPTIDSTPNDVGSQLRNLPSHASNSYYSESPVTRKRERNPELWKQNVRKNLRNRGLPYVSNKGKQMPGKTLGQACSRSCFYTCTRNISTEERQLILDHFWSLSPTEKQTFYANFVKQEEVKRRRCETKRQDDPKKKNSFKFYLKSCTKTVQVCRRFFLNTLSISERVIYYFFRKHYAVDTKESLSKLHHRGRKRTEESRIEEVKNHILSFPTVESHYCRSSTSRKYLEANLSIQKMYDLYKISLNNPVSLDIYRQVFNTKFNLGFYTPRKDVCDKCSLFKVNNAKQTVASVQLYEKHLNEKRFTIAERDADLKIIDKNTAVLVYDLQNIFSLPKLFASSFYYKRKLSVFNLTGTLILPGCEKVTYCALWNETLSGRSGNDIASALIKILNKILEEHPNINTIILWSDSCVPQNRNRITATALLQFLHDHPHIIEIKQKFSEPGHSCLQLVDCVHSVIEKYLRNVEIPSQLTLLRLLKNTNFPNTKLRLLQITDNDFKCYSIKSENMNFKDVQFFKCKSLLYSGNDLFKIGTKISFEHANYSFTNIQKKKIDFQNP